MTCWYVSGSVLMNCNLRFGSNPILKLKNNSLKETKIVTLFGYLIFVKVLPMTQP